MEIFEKGQFVNYRESDTLIESGLWFVKHSVFSWLTRIYYFMHLRLIQKEVATSIIKFEGFIKQHMADLGRSLPVHLVFVFSPLLTFSEK